MSEQTVNKSRAQAPLDAPLLSDTPPETWSRVVLASVRPQIDGGRWPIQRSLGEDVEVVAGVIVDGHDKAAVELLWTHADASEPTIAPMPLRWNDEYVARFPIERLGRYRYRVRAWLDRFATWQDQFRRRVEGGVPRAELETELVDGARLVRASAEDAPADIRATLDRIAKRFGRGDVSAAFEDQLAVLIRQYGPRDGLQESEWLEVRVDPELARFAAWYELFPRSTVDEPGQHGTLDDAAKRLDHVKKLGFDIVYLPPVHPIGSTFRKGKDNSPKAKRGEPGSPWAIGSKQGGHKAVHPELGGMDAFERFVAHAEELGIKVALDIAFQTSPDHPYVKEHPEWFQHRADGTIRYAENPPKKYQDVYPFDFESEAWQSLWQELKSVFEFWIDKGVRIFRVDNPHTKPFPFWEWCIATLREEYPDTIFLAEAFAKPKTMYTLAKLGYNNSYTYFTWRNTKEELVEYGTELFQSEIGEYYRPSFWPNTPDILTAYLAHGGRPAHVTRLVLAATMSSVYGVYGPPYEHVDNIQHPAREEYANNEKYEIRVWNWNDPDSLQPLMRRINRIRRENRALHFMRNLRFHQTDNQQIIAYSKYAPDEGPPPTSAEAAARRVRATQAAADAPPSTDGSPGEPHPGNLILCVVNLDPYNNQAGWVTLPLEELGLPLDRPYEVHDLLGGARYRWFGPSNYVELDPHSLPAHIFAVQLHQRSERDFEYFA
jgi:starch synthase (maltosyl-transferring)